MILFEEVDTLAEDERGFWSCLAQLAESTKRPLVLTCNDRAKVERSLESKAEYFAMNEMPESALQEVLHRITVEERVNLAEGIRNQIAFEARGDVRRAINTLSMVCLAAGSRASKAIKVTSCDSYRSITFKVLIHTSNTL